MMSYELCRTIVAIGAIVIMIVRVVIVLLMVVATYMFNGNDKLSLWSRKIKVAGLIK